MKTSTIAIIAISVGVAGGIGYFVAAQAFKPEVVAYNLGTDDTSYPPKLHPITFAKPDDTSDDLAQQRRNHWIDYQMAR